MDSSIFALLAPAAVVLGAATLGLAAAQLSSPINCTWPSARSGTLKQRIGLLKTPTPGRTRRLAAGGFLLLALGGGAMAAHGMGLRPSPIETSIVADLKLDYRQVDAQVASLKIPPRPPEPLNTDPVVWAKRATDDQAQAQAMKTRIGNLGPNPNTHQGDRRAMAPYLGREAQYLQAQAAAARPATVAALALTHADSESEKASLRQTIQVAQDAYRAAKDKDFAVRLAQNHYLGDVAQFYIIKVGGNGPVPDWNNYPLLRQKAQALLAQPRTHDAAQAFIAAVDAAQAAADRDRAASDAARNSDAEEIGYEYEALDRSILDRAQDAQVPANIAADIAEMQALVTGDLRLKAHLALARLDPTFPVQPKPALPAKPSLPGLNPANFVDSFARERAVRVRYEQQYRGFILGRPNPDMSLVARYNEGIRQLRAIPDPNPGQIDPRRHPNTDQQKANWDRPMPFGSPYGVDPGIAFLEEQIARRSATQTPDRAVIAVMQAHLDQLKAGKEPV